MEKGTVRTFQFGTETHQKAIELRLEILRKPLGLTFSEEFLEKEKNDWHIGYFDTKGDLLGCLILTPVEDQTQLKMRQVAVNKSVQGQGIGSDLVRFSELFATEKGFQTIVLNARATAVPFYLQLGYNCEGEPFEEVGIPHRKMTKQLRS